LPKCPHCGEADLEQHKLCASVLICPKCWWKYDKTAALKGQFIRVKSSEIKEKVSRGSDVKPAHARSATTVIEIMAHKPAGVFKDTWYSITYVEGSHAVSEPFSDPKEIGERIDKIKAAARKRFLEPKFKILWIKADPTLSWRKDEPGTKIGKRCLTHEVRGPCFERAQGAAHASRWQEVSITNCSKDTSNGNLSTWNLYTPRHAVLC
jgi:hypothetical protein